MDDDQCGLFKGTNGAPTVALERPMSTERGMAYGGRPLWSRSPHSSPSRGKPGTWRRRTGVNDEQTQRGMQSAKRRNCTERHTRTWRTRIAAGEHLSATLQPEPLPAGLPVVSTQTRGLRPREPPQRPWTVCHWRKSTASSKPCATSGSGGRRCDGSTFTSLTARPAPWAYQRGRTSCCKRSSG